MDLLKYDLKIFVDGSPRLEPEELIPVFHHWIQAQCLEELLIDVADYTHLHHGPGVILVSHDAQYSVHTADGRMGLLYSRRRETHPSRRSIQGTRERLRSVLSCTLQACRRLEREAALQGRIHFRGDELLLRINDRLHPNTEEAFDELCLELNPILADLYPQATMRLERVGEPGAPISVRIQTEETSSVATLLDRLSGNGAGKAS